MSFTVTGPAQEVQNSPATGEPTISGTAQVGQTLTASADGIADQDGLPNVFAYQWKRYDADGNTFEAIIGHDSSTYTLAESEEGKRVKVEATFTDSGGSNEGPLVSDAYPSSETVGAAGPGNTSPTSSNGTVSTDEDAGYVFAAADFSYSDSEGEPLASVKITGQPAAGEGALTVDGAPVAAADLPQTVTATELADGMLTYAPPANANGTGYSSFTFRVNDGTADSPEYTMTINVSPVNDPARGAPTISGILRAGETLVAETSDIGDDDGLTNVSYSYQWIRSDGTSDADILSATGSSYTLVEADLGMTIKVRVSFIDDAGSQESVIGLPPLQASISDDYPRSHDGATAFTFELSFSEEPTPRLSYKTLRDRAFTVTEGTIKEARRLEPPSNIGWRIRVQPSVSTDVVILLPATTDCNADGAICTLDGRLLSAEVELTVPGPASPTQAPNTPATGSPTISGTLRMGETLEAETSGIGDDDGLNNVSYDYQWIRNDGTSDADILSATGSSYTLAEADLGMTIRVRVSFTDDAGNGEQLTSAATVPVAARTETPTWSVSADAPRVAEGDSTTLTVAITNGNTFDSSQTISLAVTGTAGSADYDLPESITLPAGHASVTANVSATDDATVEGDETVILTASHGGQSIGSATVTIPANDAPAWSVSADAVQVAEGGSATLTVAIANGKTFDSDQTITLAVAGTADSADYDLSESITLPAGHASVTANVSATDDNLEEGDETVILTASHGGLSIGSATLTIPANDAPAWSVSADAAQVAEGGDSTLTAAITNGNTFDSSQTISLAATGTAGSADYRLSATTLTLAQGESSVTAYVSATDDNLEEGDETVILTASHGGLSIGSATLTIPANDAPLSTDASLSSLALSDIEIGAFSSETTAYSASVEYDLSTTTVAAVAGDDGASVVITDSNGSTDGTSRDVSLSAGDNEITVTVTAEDGDTTRVYTVTVTRAEPDVAWGERLPDLDIALDSDAGPTGLWANDTSMWVITDWFAGRVQVYARSDGAEREDRGFTLADWSGFAVAMWSNGATVWVADFTGWVRAYRLTDGARESDLDLDRSTLREAGNRKPTGLWSNGTVMWVADGRESRVFAYRLSDGSRDSAREFQLTGSGDGSISPAGLWSNGETLLVSTGQESSEVLAYRLPDGSIQAARNIDTIAANTRGIWSDGETLWVVDDQEKRIYAYAVPGLGSGP